MSRGEFASNHVHERHPAIVARRSPPRPRHCVGLLGADAFAVKISTPRWRTILLFSGLLSCSLNIAIFWVYLIWLNSRQPDLSWWKGRDSFEAVCDFLVGFGLIAAVFGKGRGRLFLGVAAVTGYLLWVTGHIGIL